MDKKIEDYIKYGLYDNVIYFPKNNIESIKEYIKKLEELKEMILKENFFEIIDLIKRENSNIYITGYISSVIKMNDDLYNFLKSKIDSQEELYISILFLKYGNKVNKKNIYRLYNDKIMFVTKKILFLENFNFKEYFIFKKREKIVQEIKKQIKKRNINQSIITKIDKYCIHPSELNHYMSYSFHNFSKIKETLALYFIEKYGAIKMISYIDLWFINGIPQKVLEKIKNIMFKKNNVDEIIFLMFLYKNIKNIYLKSYILDILNKFNEQNQLIDSDKKIDIYIRADNFLRTKIGENEKYNYLYIIGINSILISSKFNSRIYVNDYFIKKDLPIEMLQKINEKLVKLKPSINVKNTDNTKILFSNIILPNFNIIWDVTEKIKESKIIVNSSDLIVKGRSRYLLSCFLKYFNDNFENFS